MNASNNAYSKSAEAPNADQIGAGAPIPSASAPPIAPRREITAERQKIGAPIGAGASTRPASAAPIAPQREITAERQKIGAGTQGPIERPASRGAGIEGMRK